MLQSLRLISGKEDKSHPKTVLFCLRSDMTACICHGLVCLEAGAFSTIVVKRCSIMKKRKFHEVIVSPRGLGVFATG